jgi:hypothetical protein
MTHAKTSLSAHNAYTCTGSAIGFSLKKIFAVMSCLIDLETGNFEEFRYFSAFWPTD